MDGETGGVIFPADPPPRGFLRARSDRISRAPSAPSAGRMEPCRSMCDTILAERAGGMSPRERDFSSCATTAVFSRDSSPVVSVPGSDGARCSSTAGAAAASPADIARARSPGRIVDALLLRS